MKDGRNQIACFAWSVLLLLLLLAVNRHRVWGYAGTIVEQGGIPAIVSIGDAVIVESDSGTRPLRFNVRLNTVATETVTVSYKTAAATALAHLDYEQTSGLLTFTPGQVQKIVTVQVIGDILYEGDEIFYVTLVHAQNALIGDGIGQGTIIDDDNGFFLPVVMNRP